MQELCFTQSIKDQACQAREVHGKFTNNVRNVERLVTVSVHQDCFLPTLMDTTGMGILVISVYKSYGAVLFEDVVQLNYFRNKDKTL